MRRRTPRRLREILLVTLATLSIGAAGPQRVPEDRPPPPDLASPRFSLAPSVWLGLLPAPPTPLDWQPAAGRPRLAYPLRAPMTQPFGCTDFELEPTTAGCRGFHYGIDLAGPDLTPVRAAEDGVAYPFADVQLYGNHVLIQHQAGLSTLYGHLDRFVVTWGQPVRRGQVIGYEGSTGNSTGPHLHFEVHFGGRALDPLPYLDGNPSDPFPLPPAWPGLPEVTQQGRF